MTEEMTVEVVIEPEDTASAVVRVPADDLSTLLFARRQQGRVVVEFDPGPGLRTRARGRVDRLERPPCNGGAVRTHLRWLRQGHRRLHP